MKNLQEYYSAFSIKCKIWKHSLI